MVELALGEFGMLKADSSPNVEAIQSARRMKKFELMELEMIRSGYRGRFAAVYPDLKIFIYSSPSEAFDAMEKAGLGPFDCFIKCIGEDNTCWFNETKTSF